MSGLNDLIFIQSQGGLGRLPLKNDHISGMSFRYDTLPSGFSANDVKRLFSIADAEDLGIVDTHSDETKQSGGNVALGVGLWVAAETATITYDGAVLGTFVATTTTVAHMVAGLVAAINAGTVNHGFSAVDTASTTVTLTCPNKYGLHAGTIAFTTNSVAGTGVPTQFSGGAGSVFAAMHYHISEFFRLGGRELWVCIQAEATYDGSEVALIQTASNGTVRQIATYLHDDAFASGLLTILQTALTASKAAHKPCIGIMHADSDAVTLSTIADISSLTCAEVGYILGEEGNWHEPTYFNTKSYVVGEKVTWGNACFQAKTNTVGHAPFDTNYWTNLRLNLPEITGFSISHLGATLGTIANASVQESIMKVKKFNMVTGTGLDNLGMANGVLLRSQTDGLIDALTDKNYIFLRKFFGKSGSYHNDSWTAIARTNDFATIENNRTVHKAMRLIYASLIDELGSELAIDTTTGLLDEATIASFKNICEKQLRDMADAREINPITNSTVSIDPSQNVLSTSLLKVAIKIVPMGVARNIEVTIGFAIPTIS